MNNIILIFPDFNLSYSPTTLNLFNFFKNKGIDISVVSIEPKSEKFKKIDDNKIYYVKRISLFEKLLVSLKYFLLFFFSKELKYGRYRYKRQYNLFKFINENKLIKDNSIIITVDADTYCFFRRNYTHNKIIFLSLEIVENDNLISFIQENPPYFSIFQSEIRYKYYFSNNNKENKWFLLPNSPCYFDFYKMKNTYRKGYVYSGAAIDEFGFKSIIQLSLEKLSQPLIIKSYNVNEGKINFKYNQNNIILKNEYLNEFELINFLNSCRIGFCLYDSKFPSIRKFNYRTAPSGKLYTYIMAGLPIICTNQEAFNFIVEQKCGVMIDEISTENLLNAIKEIEENYDYYVENCYKVSKDYDFNKYSELIFNYTYLV
jgi:hypothetical protein